MKAMILAAGLGTRLKPFTDAHPKALAMVNGKSLLQRNIEYLQDYGIYEVVVNVHHFADQIIDAIEKNNGWGSSVTISDESDEVLETGGGLLRAKAYFENEAKWLVMNADILTDLDLGKLMEADNAFDALSEGEMVATLAVTNRTTSRNLIFNTAGTLCGWRNNTTNEEKWANPLKDPSMSVPKAFSGIQIVHANFFEALILQGKFSLIDAYLQIAQHYAIHFYDHSDGILLDVGKPESLEKAAGLFK
jgi:N-acetyl-alpha-D-muramate 1-phosphate uridylyltransferase